MIAPSLTLLRSKADNRKRHLPLMPLAHARSVLPEIVQQGGAEALVAALPGAAPKTRLTILDFLIRLAPVSDTRQRLSQYNCAELAREACSVSITGSDAEQCHALAERLSHALAAQES